MGHAEISSAQYALYKYLLNAQGDHASVTKDTVKAANALNCSHRDVIDDLLALKRAGVVSEGKRGKKITLSVKQGLIALHPDQLSDAAVTAALRDIESEIHAKEVKEAKATSTRSDVEAALSSLKTTLKHAATPTRPLPRRLSDAQLVIDTLTALGPIVDDAIEAQLRVAAQYIKDMDAYHASLPKG